VIYWTTDLSTALQISGPEERSASGSRTTSPYARWVGLQVIRTGLFYQLACYASYVVVRRGSRELRRWYLELRPQDTECCITVQELLNLRFMFYPNFLPNGKEADLHHRVNCVYTRLPVSFYFWTGWSVFTKLGISIMPLTTTHPYILNPYTW
jgi:hypothetical protein